MLIKRVFDLLVACFAFIVVSPLIIIEALLIALVLGRPVLLKQERPGFNGRPFFLYKFRTMTNERDPQGKLLPDEMRTTGLGRTLRRFSLDELPQLLNVIKGDMSMVGPRPLLMEYLPLYTEGQAQRHHVKPGLTGWAQVNGRNALSWEERFKLDVWYVDQRTFWLDLKILWLTILKVIKSEGISEPGCETMSKFTGTKEDIVKR